MTEEYSKNANFIWNALYSVFKVLVMDTMWYKLKPFVIYDKKNLWI